MIGVGATVPFITFWQSILVSGARKAAKIQYPQMYATKEEENKSKEAKKFNCTQRSHQNTLENISQFYATLFISGLHYPRIAAISGAIYVISRIIYTIGYNSGEPKNRLVGALIGYLGLLPLWYTSVSTVFELLQKTNYHF